MRMNLRYVYLCLTFFIRKGRVNSAAMENKLGHLSILSPMFVGGNITFLFIPTYQPRGIDFRVLRWHGLFPFADGISSFKEIEIEHMTLYESGQAVYLELIKVNMTWDRAVVAVKEDLRSSNAISIKLQDRTDEFLYVLSYPSQPGGSAQIAFYYPDGFNEFDAVNHWWLNRYGGDAQTDLNEKRIVFTVFNISPKTVLYLEYRKHTTVVKSNDVYLFIGRPQLRPICTTFECSDCVCVFPGDGVTCSTEGTVLSMWIGTDGVDVRKSNSSGSNEYTTNGFSITNLHHMSTVRCYVVFEKRNIVFNSSATLYVLGFPPDSSSPGVPYILIYILLGTAAAIAFVAIPLCIKFKRRRRTRKKTRSPINRGECINMSVPNQSEQVVGSDEISDHEYAEIEEELQPSNTSNKKEYSNEPHYRNLITSPSEPPSMNTGSSGANHIPETPDQMEEAKSAASLAYEQLKRSDSDLADKYTALKPPRARSQKTHYENV